MRKIPTLFIRDETDRRYVTDEINPACAWVFTDSGVTATRKFDGTCVKLDDAGAWWARREVKPGKTPPARFVPVETDDVTGKTMGWEPIGQSSFAKYHAEAIAEAHGNCEDPWQPWAAGTYELIGPRINGNPERYDTHWLIAHATACKCMWAPFTPAGVRDRVLYLHAESGQEGIVFKHPDGRMAKIKARDFRTTEGA